MADTTSITIPSPTVFLIASPKIAPQSSPPKPETAAPAKAKQTRKRNPSGVKSRAIAAIDKPGVGGGVTASGTEKKKQTKSRHGCVTCKAKRLKCDETKPTCQQCARRNVECGGYKKDFKWRPFAEIDFIPSKPSSSSKAKKEVTFTFNQKVPVKQHVALEKIDDLQAAPTVNEDNSENVLEPSSEQPMLAKSPPPADDEDDWEDYPDQDVSPEVFNFEDENGSIPHRLTGFGAGISSAVIPPLSLSFADLTDSMLDYPDLSNLDPSILVDTHDSTPDLSPMGISDHRFFTEPEEEEVEEVVRSGLGSDQDLDPWTMAPVLPTFYSSSMPTVGSSPMFPFQDTFPIPRGNDNAANSPEAITTRFHSQTCGILSMKDGPNENPWRTLIWPLAQNSPALYHAIASMTSFHTSKHEPEFRVQGIDHMRRSIEALASGIEDMQFDTAIATTLALAFAESWDQHTSTGINHIRGAKVLVNQALNWHGRKAFDGDKLERLKFLTNAWVYMDVLARLTSEDNDDSNAFDAALSNPFVSSPFGEEGHIDPLMGAASSLFPIIGRVANLVRRVRRTERNSPTMISQAMELKTMLQEWDPPIIEEAIEDPSVEIEHSIQTAEAYRWATLLYLHQAVPEIPSDSSAELGKKVMVLLATVPLSSRTVIVHIYPLMAASCEAVDLEDRQWVHERWLSMAQRMKIGIIDRCVEVVNEVWKRRDTYEPLLQRKTPGFKRGSTIDSEFAIGAELGCPWSESFVNRKRRATSGAFDMLRDFSTNPRPKKASRSNSGPVDHAFTVRGRLHWLSVMKEWGWEVLLG